MAGIREIIAPYAAIMAVTVSNPVYEAARTMLAVREYQDRAVPTEVITRVARTAHLTASAGNGQPWHFVVVQDRERLRRLGQLVRTGPYIARSAFAIVVGIEKDNRTAVSDASRAIESMMLTAWAEGVGSNWTGFAGLDPVAREVGLPEKMTAIAVVPFGYPARNLGKGIKKRRPFDEVVSAEVFGTALS